ncbi:DUF2484 family protein [Aliiroseovarius sp. PTFE2010]|uniref:DUF2484 family protein n=1 Tax=Aliiroseovarius sp. PTFE2010 TaxID=3417190 RepID=UPI003CE72351
MTWSVVAFFVWAIVANLVAMVPSRRKHWPQAYALIAVGIPLLGWITLENGPFFGLIALAAGMSMLRWPVRYLGRWMQRQIGK